MTTAARAPHVVVVGGGIAGLAAAAALRARSPKPLRITVLEGSPGLGGKLALTEVGGVVTDAGAEALLARRPEALALARSVGLGDDLEDPASSGASVWSRGVLRPLPSGQLMGVPGDLRALAASGVVSVPGLARVPLDHVLPRTPADDVSIGDYVAARLGREVVDRLVEPLLGGVYAGHADELSLDATVPQLAAVVRAERSLLRGVRQVLRAADPTRPPAPVFASIHGGVGRLPAAVAAASGAEVRTSAMVRELRRASRGWRLVVGPTRDAETLGADAVILALPAPRAARLLGDVVPYAAADLAAIDYASVGIVTLAIPTAQLGDRVVGTGFLVPPVEGRTIKAATYSSQKWGWVAAASPDLSIIRTSVGRHREVADLQRDDAELVALAVQDLSDALGVALQPVDAVVTRWGGSLPQYAVGHVERVARIRSAVAGLPGIAVCGAAYDGIGIAACIASGETAATLVLAGLAERGQWGHG